MLARLTRLLLIQESERPHVLFFILIFLLLGTGMALGRGTADALFFKRYGIQYLPIMYGVLSVVLATVSITYAAYADRLPAEKFFRTMLYVLIGTLAATWAAMTLVEVEFAYPAYFLVYEVASELLLLHGALYMSQNFDILQSKRLTPIIFAAAQIGTIIGGLFLAGAAPLIGVPNVILIWAGLLALSAVLLHARHKRSGVSPFFQPPRRSRGGVRHTLDQIVDGLRFTRESALLRAASFALFFMVLAFYVMCYSINRIYAATFTTEESLSAFFGILTATTSAIALVVQLFITNRLFQKFGVKRANLIFPIGGIISYGALLLAFALPAALIGSFVRDVLMPAIRRPTRNLFFSALPDYMQGRARALSVALVLPVALATASGLLVFTQRFDNTYYFLIPGLAAALCYLYFTLRMNRAYLHTMIGTLKEKVFLPGRHMDAALKDGDKELVAELARGVEQNDEALAVAYAKILATGHPEAAVKTIIERAERASVRTRDVLVKLLASINAPNLTDYCWQTLNTGDDHLKSTVAGILFASGSDSVEPLIRECLAHDNPRVIATGIYGAYQKNLTDLKPKAQELWEYLLTHERPQTNIAGLELLARKPLPELLPHVQRFLTTGDDRIKKASLAALRMWPPATIPELEPELSRLARSLDPELRRLGVECYPLLPEDSVDRLALLALEDPHPSVRDAAIGLLDDGGAEFPDLLAGLILGNAGSPRAQKALLVTLARLRPPQQVFSEIAEAKAADAEALQEACVQLAMTDTTGGENGELMCTVLQERRDQVLDLALMAMEHVEDRATIEIIRAGLRTGDQRQVASACEALRNIHNEKLATNLGLLLESRLAQSGHTQDTNKTFGKVDDVLAWCERRPDPWLRDCVSFFRAGLANVEG